MEIWRGASRSVEIEVCLPWRGASVQNMGCAPQTAMSQDTSIRNASPLVAQILGTGPSPKAVAGRFDVWTIWQDDTTKVVTSKAALFRKV